MSPKLFISYAWTSDTHRAWVRLLASNLRAVGYNVMIDEAVKYGDSLNGFMREIQNADHVLMIIDQNYVERANTLPESGVGYENHWVQAAFQDKPTTWLTALFVSDSTCVVPDWLEEYKPKSFDFRSNAEQDSFPGSIQIEELWRWIEDLPTDKTHAITVSQMRERAARLEKIDRQRDPDTWANPQISGKVHFNFLDAPGKGYSLGAGEHHFTFQVSGCGYDSIYVYKDYIHSVGLVPTDALDSPPFDQWLTPGRTVTPRTGQGAILMNKAGHLCLVKITKVQHEINTSTYVAPYVEFEYQILVS